MNGEMLKTAGYKVGDTLWKPGAKDDLNGRELTGRIKEFTQQGTPLPEYVHDAINSSHKSTGNAGYAGEVGLGADQAAYNREYERNNDVTTGQMNQQLEANGFDTEEAGGTNQYGDPSGTSYAGGSPTFNESTGQYESYTGADGTVSNGPQGAGQSETNKTQANYNNSYASFNYQPNTSQYGSRQFDFRSSNNKTMNLNFDFDPNRFNQGQ